MPILICSDRDGTINEDNDYYLGKDPCWIDQIQFLPQVVEGIQFLKLSLKQYDPFFFILTNQSGVAIADPAFAALTEARMCEVNRYMIHRLGRRGAPIDGYFACPYVDHAYVQKNHGKHQFHPEYVVLSHPDLKPNRGMIDKANEVVLKKTRSLADRIYMIGDRASDVELGLCAHGKGILVESEKTKALGDREKVEILSNRCLGRVYIAKDFLDAAIWIRNDVLT